MATRTRKKQPKSKPVEATTTETTKAPVEAVQSKQPEAAPPEQSKAHVEAGQSEQQTPAIKPAPVEVDNHFKINGKPQFWNNKVFIPGTGVKSGAVTVEDKKTFFAASPGSNLTKWMSDFDPVEKRIKDAKAKMRRKIGLD